MKYLQSRWMKLILTAAVWILAGVCYSCARQEAAWPALEGGEQGILSLTAAAEEGGPDRMVPDGQESREEQEEQKGREAAAQQPLCFVHICGAVVQPGVYQLEEGSRIYQAVELAGGFLPEADQTGLNLAAPIADGMKVTVLTVQEAETAEAEAAGSRTGTEQNGKVNINTAGLEELMTLRGIGKARAGDIIAYRKEHGPFRRIEDIMQVSGIKDSAFQKIKDDITV